MPSPRPGKEGDKPTRNEVLVEMTKQIVQSGPEIDEIARHLHVFKETLRYHFHRHLRDRGFQIQANLDYQKLGLKRVTIIARLSPGLEEKKLSIMSALSSASGVTEVAETILEGLFIVQLTVPAELREECIRIYERLNEAGLFSEMSILRFEGVRNVPMKPEYFDFANGAWAYDWRNERQKSTPVRHEVAPSKYDEYDLLILNALDSDANLTLRIIAERLHLTHKMALYHYNSHIKPRGLIRNYRIIWQGASYDTRAQRRGPTRHSYVEFALVVKGEPGGRWARFSASLGQMPFLLLEAYEPDYYAELSVPAESYIDFLVRIRELAVQTGSHPTLYTLDRDKGLRFSGIPWWLYDGRNRRWQLDGEGSARLLKGLALAEPGVLGRA